MKENHKPLKLEKDGIFGKMHHKYKVAIISNRTRIIIIKCCPNKIY